MEVRGKAFHLYKGTYSQFLIEREARAQAAQAMRERLDMKADKLEVGPRTRAPSPPLKSTL